MIQIIQESLVSVWKNRWIYIKSLLFLTVLQGVVFLPVLGLLFNQMLRVADLQSITETTVKSVLMNPLAIGLLIVLVFLVIVAIYIEMGFFFLLARSLAKKEQITAKGIIIQLAKRVRHFISFQLVLFIVYLLLLLPLASIGLQSMLTDSLRLPYFIADELFKSRSGTLLYFALLLIVFYISMRLLFTLPLFILDKKKNVLGGMKDSWFVSKGNTGKNIFVLGSLLIGYHFLLGLVGLFLVSPVFIVEAFSPSWAPWVAGIMLTFIQILFVLSFGLLQAIMAEAIIRLGSLNQSVSNLPYKSQERPFFSKPLSLFIKLGLALVILATAIGNLVTMKEGLYAPSTMVIAHRGDTSQAIENTLTALVAAAKIESDYVELDVMETKDKQLIVFHDETLRRLANKSSAIKDLTLAEIKDVSLVSNGLTDRIPTFAEFIDVAKEHQIKLLVEIKLHGNESPEMVQNIVNLLAEKNVTRDYLVQSLDGDIVKKVKELNPEIKTGYLVAFNVGNIPSIPADFLVLEDFSVNQRLLNQARELNKTVFVWTVNRETLMRQYLRMDIDGMITNQPKRAIELRQSFEEEKSFGQRVRDLIN